PLPPRFVGDRVRSLFAEELAARRALVRSGGSPDESQTVRAVSPVETDVTRAARPAPVAATLNAPLRDEEPLEPTTEERPVPTSSSERPMPLARRREDPVDASYDDAATVVTPGIAPGESSHDEDPRTTVRTEGTSGYTPAASIAVPLRRILRDAGMEPRVPRAAPRARTPLVVGLVIALVAAAVAIAVYIAR
ncbi:MAG: hypothetical protein WCJ30_23170, partial [Deltaproteobacteria bacterium]